MEQIVDPRATSRRGSYAKILSRRGSALTIDFRQRDTLSVSKDDITGSPKSPLAASTSTLSLIGTPNGDSKARIFKALSGIEYAGIVLPSDETLPPPNTAAPFAGVPVFLSPDGTLYDVNYIQVTEYTPPTNGAAQAKDKLAFVPGSPVYNNFPEVESFENFFDYEQAVMDWKDSVLKNLGWLQLPTVLGRFYSRPKLISESRARRDSTTSSDSTSFQDLLDEKGGLVSTGSYVDSPPVDRMGSMDAFEFVPSPLHDNVLDRVGSTVAIDSDQENESYSPSGGGVAALQRQLNDMSEHDFQRAAHDALIEHLHDSPNNSEREDVSKSPRTIFRKSQSFSRSGSGSSSPGGPHRKLTHRLSDPGDLRAEGYEETRWLYSRDPWESTLVPPEPTPAFYATYEEYEAAMKRWAKECISKMSYIPPHPLQLQEVIQLCPALENINDRAHSVPEAVPNIGLGQELPRCKVKSGENTYEQLHEPLHKRKRSPTPPRPPPPPKGPDGVATTKLSAPAQRKLLECIDTLSRNIDPVHLVRRFDILPAFPPNWKQSMQNKVAAHLIPDLPLKAARRTDIFSELDMSPLQKEFPDPEPVLNFSKLTYSKQASPENQQYTTKAKQSIIELDQAFRHDHLYSTYATSSPKEPKEQVLLRNLLGQGPTTLEILKKILTSRMFVDKFKDIMADTVPNSYDDSTYLSVFMDLLNGENLRSILDYLEDSTEELVHGKVSALISSILATPKGHTWVALVIENYVDHEDIKSLYNFALAANYLQVKSTDIYPYRPNIHAAIIKKVFKSGGVQGLVDQVYIYYYLGLISKYSSHPDIKEWLDSKKKEVSDQMANNLQKDKIFLVSDIFRGISHRSSSLSNFFLFIITQLLHCYDVSIQRLLRSPDVGLVTSICNLACSKFIHTQYAARRLFGLLLDDPWRDFFLSELDKGKTFFDDMTTVSNSNPDMPSLLSTLLLTVVDSAMANIPKNKDQRKNYAGGFLLTDELFHKALNTITKAKHLDASIETASVFMVTVSKALFIHNLAEASDKLKTTTKTKMEKSQEIVQISLADIQLITNFIYKVNANDKYHIRTNMLNCLRNLLKHSRTFDFIKKELHIHHRLVSFCKEGKNMAFNKTAWKLFYQLIHYHKDAIEQFEKSKVLAQFLDILGTNSGNTIMLNSLHYTYKIFAILDTEAERIKSGKMPSRSGDMKSIEKDLKALSRTFVQSHLFIKIHMMYKRLVGHQQGASFVQLGLLYHIIGKNPLCKKLCKDIQRNPEYKDGLFKICSMFEPPNTAMPVPNLAPM